MCLSEYAFVERLQVDTDVDTPILFGHHDHSCAPVSWDIHLGDGSQDLHVVELLTDFLSEGNGCIPGCKRA